MLTLNMEVLEGVSWVWTEVDLGQLEKPEHNVPSSASVISNGAPENVCKEHKVAHKVHTAESECKRCTYMSESKWCMQSWSRSKESC